MVRFRICSWEGTRNIDNGCSDKGRVGQPLKALEDIDQVDDLL